MPGGGGKLAAHALAIQRKGFPLFRASFRGPRGR